jgi:hypothetical protein
MPRRNSPLEILQARKSLLLLEADLHREQLIQEGARLKISFRNIKEKFKPARSFLGLAGLALTGLDAYRQTRHEKGSVIPRLLKFLAAIWGVFPRKE